jgi:hypothetical protein
MEISTLTYRPESGWSQAFPAVDSANTLIIVFGAPQYIDDLSPFQQLSEAYPQAQIIGCSSSGEIFNNEVQDESLVVGILPFKHSRIKTSIQCLQRTPDTLQIGKQIVDELLDEDLKGILVLSNGVNINGSRLVCGLQQQVPKHIAISGGLAGDGTAFEKTWILARREPHVTCVTAVGFYGDNVRFSCSSQGGWDIFGPERLITRAKDNVVYEIDHKPALALYKNYLGERANELPSAALLFPLAIRENEHSEKKIVRTILSVDEAEQSMTFAGDVPEGYYTQLMRSNFDRLIDGAVEASAIANQRLQQYPHDASCYLQIAVSCVGRRLILGTRTEEEVEAALENAPKNTQQIGFYSYGEISSSGLGECDLHNQTMTLTLIGEA